MRLNHDEYLRIANYIQAHFGIHLTEQKKTLIQTRLDKVIKAHNFANYGQYLDYLELDTTGVADIELLNRITTNHTYFYREQKHFEFFRRVVIPYIKEKEDAQRDIRIWSAGCSTGDEPYTLSILLKECLYSADRPWDMKILATDISTHVLELAKKGVYGVEQVEDLPDPWKRKYIKKQGPEQVQIASSIRENVIFRRFNLMSPFPFRKRFHVIFCRNVMIYFDQQTKRDLIKRFYDVLEPGGYLFIGHSETLDRKTSPFTYVMPSIYRKEERY